MHPIWLGDRAPGAAAGPPDQHSELARERHGNGGADCPQLPSLHPCRRPTESKSTPSLSRSAVGADRPATNSPLGSAACTMRGCGKVAVASSKHPSASWVTLASRSPQSSADLRGPNRKYGKAVSGWHQQLVSRIGSPGPTHRPSHRSSAATSKPALPSPAAADGGGAAPSVLPSAPAGKIPAGIRACGELYQRSLNSHAQSEAFWVEEAVVCSCRRKGLTASCSCSGSHASGPSTSGRCLPHAVCSTTTRPGRHPGTPNQHTSSRKQTPG